MSKVTHRGRSGWTLLEIMVVLPLMALLLSASAMLLTALFRSQESLWADVQQQSTHARLAVQFRADAHGSRSARCDSPQHCVFTLDDGGMVHYEIKGHTLHREARRGEAVTMRESYPLTGLAGEFSLDSSGELPLVRLHFIATDESQKYEPVARSSLWEAAVGSLRERHTAGGPQS